MASDDIQELRVRVARLENEVAGLRYQLLGARAAGQVTGAPVRPEAPAEPVRPVSVTVAPPAASAPARDAEEDFVGTWFARLGAIAVLLGAAFGFKYAVDRGYIGPAGRVAIGATLGVTFLLLGEAAARRTWNRLAQAVSGGGIALLFLSVWAATNLYGLIDATSGLLLLGTIAGGGAVLAVRHGSLALAVVATAGGFLDAMLIGPETGNQALLFGFVLALNLGVVGLAITQRWSSLAFVALAGSWILHAGGADDRTVAGNVWFGTVVYVLFALVPLAQSRLGRAERSSVPLIWTGSVIYVVAMLAILESSHESWQPLMTAGVGVFGAMLAAVTRPEDRDARIAYAATALVWGTVTVGLQFRGVESAIIWATEAVALLWIAGQTSRPGYRRAALLVMGVSLARSVLIEFELGGEYRTDAILASPESATLAWQVAALFAMAWMTRGSDLARPLAIAGNALALAWFSWEANAYLERGPFRPDREQILQFSLSTIWGLYAAGLMAVGVVLRSRGARMMSAALFGVVILKMTLIDLWQLQAAYRVIAFLGIGAVLLLVSLTYHRFRDFIMGEGEQPAAA